MAAALMACLTGAASSGTLAGQFTGASTAVGAPACPTAPQYTAPILGSVTYVENTYTDPLLSGALYQAGVDPELPAGARESRICGPRTARQDVDRPRRRILHPDLLRGGARFLARK
jgi:hypothetical protein